MSTRGPKEAGREVRLGGIGEKVAAQIGEITGKDIRCIVLGHLQRGGRPTTYDRLLALRFGAAAVRLIKEENFGHMVAIDPPEMIAIPLEECTSRTKQVPLECDTVLTARDLGISFGD
jgi:6-phosphofructokinase 1